MATITGQWRRWVWGSDSHGRLMDESANAAFFKFVKLWEPHIRIAGGDHFDFAQLRKKADAYEKRDSMAQDIAAGTQWLEEFRPNYWMLGNHEARLWDLAEQAEGIVADYAKMGVERLECMAEKMKCRIYPYERRRGVLHMGSLKFVHGYLLGITAARRHAQIYGSVVFGHTHDIQMQTIEGIEPRAGFATGCLCKTEMGYNRAQAGTLKWECGFAYGLTNLKTGAYQYWQARKVDNAWLLPTGIEIL